MYTEASPSLGIVLRYLVGYLLGSAEITHDLLSITSGYCVSFIGSK